MGKKWKNKVGYGQTIILDNNQKIKIVTWYRYDFTEMELQDKNGKTLIGVLAYSEKEIQKYIDDFKHFKKA
jgi:hypothetical protein